MTSLHSRGYDLGAILGEGGNGKVYKVKDRKENKDYALKYIELKAQDRASVELEVEHLKKLKSAFIVGYKEHWYTEYNGIQFLYIVQELAAEGDLNKYMRPEKHLEEDVIVDILTQVLLAAAALHSHNMVHRDIKPGNILVSQVTYSEDGESIKDMKIKLADFGTARDVENSITCKMTQAGTKLYWPSEVFDNEVSKRTDIYAIGVVAYELCTRRRPFTGWDPAAGGDWLAGWDSALEQNVRLGKYTPIADITDKYTEALRQLIDSCLERESVLRLSVQALLQLPIIRKMVSSKNYNIPIEEGGLGTLYGETQLITAVRDGDVGTVRALVEHDVKLLEAVNANGDTVLMFASHHGNVEMVNALLGLGATKDIETKNKYGGWTPLTRAAANGHVDVVQALLDAGAEKEAASKHGETPLIWAAYRGRVDVINVLLKAKADVEKGNQGNSTPLMFAAANGQLGSVQALLENGAKATAASGSAALRHAVSIGHVGMVCALLEAGANTEAPEGRQHGETPLMIAARNGNVEVVSALLERDANQEATNKNNETPLMLAAAGGNVDVVRALLHAKSDKEAKTKDGVTSLMLAAANGHVAVVIALLGAEAEFEAKDKDGITSLMLAAAYGHIDVLDALLSVKANLEAADERGSTPLRLAVSNGHVRVVGALLEAGASHTDEDGKSLLILAITEGHDEVALDLLKRGVNKDVADKEGKTPLMWAVIKGHCNVALDLLRRGADTKLLDQDGKTALKHAQWLDVKPKVSLELLKELKKRRS